MPNVVPNSPALPGRYKYLAAAAVAVGHSLPGHRTKDTDEKPDRNTQMDLLVSIDFYISACICTHASISCILF